MINIKDNINRLNASQIVRYVDYLGWHKIADIPNIGVQYASRDEEYVINIITNKELLDYDKAVLSSLKTLSKFTLENIDSIILKLLYPAFDRIKWRVAGIETLNGTIPFNVLPDLIQSIKDTFAVTINDLENPSTIHRKLRTKDSSTLFKELQFGQTEFGSYIINVLSPLGGYQWDLFGEQKEIPITRKVTEKLLQSVHDIFLDLGANNRQKIEEELEQQKYSVNFLQSILSIQQSTIDASIEISADWCVSLLPTVDIPNVAYIQRKYIDLIGQIIEKYTEYPDELEEYSFVGKIASIESEPEINNRKYVRIKMATIGTEKKALNVYANLDYNDYFDEVNKAFAEGLNIQVRGLFDVNAKVKEVVDARFDII